MCVCVCIVERPIGQTEMEIIIYWMTNDLKACYENLKPVLSHSHESTSKSGQNCLSKPENSSAHTESIVKRLVNRQIVLEILSITIPRCLFNKLWNVSTQNAVWFTARIIIYILICQEMKWKIYKSAFNMNVSCECMWVWSSTSQNAFRNKSKI